MTWWWESIHANNLYQHWSALTAFLDGSGIGRADMKPASFSKTGGSLTPYGVAAPDHALVWLLDKGCDWPDGAMTSDPALVTGAQTTIIGLEDGLWEIEWWDTLQGKRVAIQDAPVAGGSLQLEPPAFHADIAARLKRK